LQLFPLTTEVNPYQTSSITTRKGPNFLDFLLKKMRGDEQLVGS